MDNKTKEIVERLDEKIIVDALEDGRIKSGVLAERLLIERQEASAEIRRLSERVGELERELDFSLSRALSGDVPWTPDVHRRLEGGRALLSKQEERVLNEQEQKVMQRALRNSVKFVNKQGEGQ